VGEMHLERLTQFTKDLPECKPNLMVNSPVSGPSRDSKRETSSFMACIHSPANLCIGDGGDFNREALVSVISVDERLNARASYCRT